MVKRVRPGLIALLITFAVMGLLGVERARAQEAEPATPIAITEDTVTGTITVTVLNEDGVPISGVTATLYRGEAAQGDSVSNGRGVATFTDVPAGTYVVEVIVGHGFPVQRTAPFDLSAGQRVDKIVVAQTTGTLVVYAVDQSGAPVAGAEVTLLHEQDSPRVGRTDHSGAVGFGELPPGNYSGSVASDTSGAADIAPFEVVGGATVDLTVTLLPFPEAFIAVTNESGAPVKGASVSLSRSGEAPIVGTTGGDGTRVFSGLAPGTYRGSVTGSGYGDAEIAPFDLTFGDVVRIEVTLPPPPPGAIQFTVTDEHGVAIAGAEIALYLDGSGKDFPGLTTNAAGEAHYAGLLPGSEYYATVDASGYFRELPDNIVVQHGKTTDVTVKMERQPPPTTGAITVRVVINGQEVLSGGTVYLYGKTTTSEPMDRQGEAIFTNVQPGVYVIVVDAAGLGSKAAGPFEVAAGQTLDQVVDISERSPGDTGTVVVETYTQESYPHPLANVRVTLSGQTTTYSQTQVSDEKGTLVFQGVPPGYYHVEAEALDANNIPYAGEGDNFDVSAGEVSISTMHIDLNPEPGTASLSISVLNEQDEPISGASVSVESLLGTASLETSSSGYAFATDLPPGDVIVIAATSGYVASDPVTVAVEAGTRASVTIRLSRVEQALEPTPVQPMQPASQVVVQLPSTGAGSGANGWWLTASLLLVAAAGIAMAGGGWVRRR